MKDEREYKIYLSLNDKTNHCSSYYVDKIVLLFLNSVVSQDTDIFKMVIQNMLRTHTGKYVFSRENPICDCSPSNQMPLTDQITEIASYLRTYF